MIIERNLPRRHYSKTGLTLLEVLLSIAILGGALVVIGQLVNLGYRSAVQAQLRTDANIHLDTKMAEVVCGAVPLESVGGGTLEEDPSWAYSIDIASTDVLGLLRVTVTVTRIDSSVPVEVMAMRLVPDPDFDPLEDQE